MAATPAGGTDPVILSFSNAKPARVTSDTLKNNGILDAWKAGKSVAVRLQEGKMYHQAVVNGVSLLKDLVVDPLLPETLWDKFPMLPVPVLPSLLYLALTGQTSVAAPMSSFTLLSYMMSAEKYLASRTGLPAKPAQFQKANKERVMTLEQIRMYAVVSFGRILSAPQDQTAKSIHRENFYNQLNFIRIFEFTIMEYLDVPQTRQPPLVCGDAPLTPENPVCSAELKCELQQQLLAVLKSQQDRVVPAAERVEWGDLLKDYGTNFDISAVLPQLNRHMRAVLSEELFVCSNLTNQCRNQEKTKGEYKKCARCGWQRYCSRPCQVAHWKSDHKEQCGTVASLKALDERRLLIAGDSEA